MYLHELHLCTYLLVARQIIRIAILQDIDTREYWYLDNANYCYLPPDLNLLRLA